MSIYELGFDNLLTKNPLFGDTVQSANNFSQGIAMQVIQSGDMAVNANLVDGYLQSSNFVTGSAGWQIDAEGNVEFNNGNFRGDIGAATGTFTNTLYVGDTKIEIDGEGTTYGFKVKDASNNVVIFMGIQP